MILFNRPIAKKTREDKFYLIFIIFLRSVLLSIYLVFEFRHSTSSSLFFPLIYYFSHVTFCTLSFHRKITYGRAPFPFSGSGQPLKTILLHLSTTIATLYPVITVVLLWSRVNFSIWVHKETPTCLTD